MIKAVIFDIDDTLYSFRNALPPAMEAICRYAEANLGIPGEEFGAQFSQEYRRLQEEQGQKGIIHNRQIRFLRILEARGLPLHHVPILDKLFWDTLYAAMVPEPGIHECMAGLRDRGYRVGIGSNMMLSPQMQKLIRLDLLQYCNFVVTSEEAVFDKPELPFFALCVKKAGVDPGECLFIGDNLQNDVLAPEKAGMQALWYAPEAEDFSGHPGITHFSQLLDFLDRP